MNQVIRKTFKGCTLIFSFLDDFRQFELNIINNDIIHIHIDLTKMPIKIDDWYYIFPFSFYVDPLSTNLYFIHDDVRRKVDNLTYIEELAKEKNLI